MLNVGRMLVVALVGHADPSIERAKTDLLVQLEGVVALIGVLDSGRTVLWRLVQPFKVFPGNLFAAMFGILLDFRPESDVG